ncbi:hypothetical protein pipiens_015316 [Culex pipiens pipiens]|uniref:Uncharacterized protein n=1 Tax=Culex pipiens pipiens TaxID=38569 RepID=A0ABD1CR45_CULPP
MARIVARELPRALFMKGLELATFLDQYIFKHEEQHYFNKQNAACPTASKLSAPPVESSCQILDKASGRNELFVMMWTMLEGICYV